MNKLGLAAETVRRKWVREELLARKTPPAEAAGFVASVLASDAFLLTQNKARETTVALLGTATDRLTEDIDAAAPGRAQVLTLALVLGAYEARTTKDAWRHGYTTKGVDRYLHFLRDLGYRLSEVERVAAGDIRAEDMDTD